MKCENCCNECYKRTTAIEGCQDGKFCWREHMEEVRVKREAVAEDFEFKIEPLKFRISKTKIVPIAMIIDINLALKNGAMVILDSCTYTGFEEFDMNVGKCEFKFYSGSRKVETTIPFGKDSSIVYRVSAKEVIIEIQ